MKVLITGGAGFIGSHVARHCVNLGFETIVMDDLSGGFEDNVPQGSTFVKEIHDVAEQTAYLNINLIMFIILRLMQPRFVAFLYAVFNYTNI